MLRVVATLLCLLVALSATTPAAANDAPDPRARALFREGITASKEQRWADARRALEKAVAIERAPILLYSLAVAERNTGKLVAAAGHFHEFLRLPAQGRSRAFREPAERALAEVEGRIGHVVVVLEPAAADAVVRIDDEALPRSALGGPHPIDPGTHVITVTAPGYRNLRRTIAIEPRGHEDVTLRLTAAPGHVPIVPAVVLGIGGALMLAGVAVGVVGIVEATEARAADEAEPARAKAIAGNVTVGAGLLTFGVGLVLLLVNDDEAADSHAAISPWAGANGAGIELRF